jgi:hypothetical protein
MDMRIVLVLVSIFLLNILFGYWRSNTKRLSVQWMMSIHVPVPIAVGLRLSLLGWSWTLLPAFVTAFATGQYARGKIRHYFASQGHMHLTSCLVMDVGQSSSAPHVRQNDGSTEDRHVTQWFLQFVSGAEEYYGKIVWRR